MSGRLSRRRIANYVAEQLLDESVDHSVLLRQVAAYLITTGAVREAGQMVAAIEEALAQRGVVLGTVTTAHLLSDAQRREIVDRLQLVDQSVQLRSVVDPRVIGGVKVTLPGRQYDGTIQHKLTTLAGAK